MNQSFKQYFVTNNPTLLASGTTSNLAVEQIGIFDGVTYQATTTPTYATNKSILIAQGTPDRSYFPKGAGIDNETKKSKIIEGKKLKGFRGKKAAQGHTQVVAVGYDGVDATKTISAKFDETKYLYIRLTGAPIEKLLPGVRGWVTTLAVTTPCIDECTDNSCENVDCGWLADQFISKLNDIKLPGGIPITKYIRATKITSCDASLSSSGSTLPFTKFCLSVCDTGDNAALGNVQSQYPDSVVTRVSRTGAISSYELWQSALEAAPDPFNNEANRVVPNCETCPDGYTLNTADKYFYIIQRTDDGNDAALTTFEGDYTAVADASTAYRLNYQFGTSFYGIYSSSSTTPISTAAGLGDTVSFTKTVSDVCILDTPGEVDWTECGEGFKVGREYSISLRDTVCGDSRLVEIQALVGDRGTVEESEVNPVTCTRLYTVTIESDNILENDCTVDAGTFTPPITVDGADWTFVQEPAAVDDGDCACGIVFESSFVARRTNICAFAAFPYEQDGIHIQLSQHNPDFTSTDVACETDWAVTTLREIAYPAGTGEYIIRLEKSDKSYDLDEFSPDSILRNAEGYYFFTDPDRFYDEYVLEFEIDYPVGGFSIKYTDSYHVHVFVPEGTGTGLEAALNSYVTSVPVMLQPVVL